MKRKPLSTIDDITVYNVDFVKAWQTSSSAREVCKKLHIVESAEACRKVSALASRLRVKGVPMVKFKGGSSSIHSAQDYSDLADLAREFKESR